MSIVAIVPVANLVAANAALSVQGFGPANFSVPAYTGPAATHAALHCWNNPAFAAAVSAIAGVVTESSNGDPATRVKALIEAQGATWGDHAPLLPSTGTVTAGKLYWHGSSMWSVIQTFSRTTYSADPATYPALIRRVRSPYAVEAWAQPIDQYDAYNLANPFTGRADRCLWNGVVYETKINANTYSPSGYPAGWQVVP